MITVNWKKRLHLLLPFFLLMGTTVGAQVKFQLPTPTEKDFVAPEYQGTGLHPADQLAAEKNIQTPQPSQSAASFSWFVGGMKEDIAAHPKTFLRESKEYWFHTKGRQLKQGVSVPFSAAGALVKINPKSNDRKEQLIQTHAIDPLQIELIAPDGKRFSQGQGMAQVADAKDLADSGSPFPAGTSAFTMKSELGAGTFKLRTAQDVDDEGDYFISVMEKNSDDVLTVQMDKANLAYGQSMLVKASYKQSGKAKVSKSMKAVLRSPAGKEHQVTMVRGKDNEYQGKLPMAFEKDAIGELWEVEVSMDHQAGKQSVRRMGKTAFSYAIPTARLLEDVSVNQQQMKKGRLSVQFNLDVAVEGRYEMRAVLYATDGSGNLRPAVVGQSANWLREGQQTLSVAFPLQEAQQKGFGAPYEIKRVSLHDQKQLALLHYQANGIRLEQ
jgi:hypothetical protein